MESVYGPPVRDRVVTGFLGQYRDLFGLYGVGGVYRYEVEWSFLSPRLSTSNLQRNWLLYIPLIVYSESLFRLSRSTRF